jgi:hypothetical protein
LYQQLIATNKKGHAKEKRFFEIRKGKLKRSGDN